jgi:hypothetical protein
VEHGLGRAERKLTCSGRSRFHRADTAHEAGMPAQLEVGGSNKQHVRHIMA